LTNISRSDAQKKAAQRRGHYIQSESKPKYRLKVSI
jgi:hypothetical protein